jgi:hypothetical protein
MTLLSEASFLVTPNGYKASKLYAAIPVPVEIAVNGNFLTDTNWTKGDGWTIANGFATAIGDSGNLDQSFSFTNNATYTVKYTITDYTVGSIRIILYGDGFHGIGTTRTANGVYTESITTSTVGGSFTNNLYIQTTTTNESFKISNVSVKLDTDMTVTRATTATRVDENDLVSSVASNVPRIDYTGGGCPSILLEPQRTNLLTYSEQFDNASFQKNSSSISANNTTAPDGTLTADTWTGSGTSSTHFLAQVVSATSGVAYTQSVFAKKGTNNFLQILGTTAIYDVNSWVNFDLENGVISTIGSSATATITDFGNGWYRCAMTATATATSVGNGFLLWLITSAASARAEYNDLATSVHLWGAQVEAGAYPTSYIPTTTGTVTRLIDSCHLLNHSLFTDYPFTVYANAEVDAVGNTIFSLNNTSSQNYYLVFYFPNSTQVGLLRRDLSNNDSDFYNFSYSAGDTIKVAVAFISPTAYKLYINGAEIANVTSGASVPFNHNDISLGQFRITGDTGTRNSINEFMVFNEVLSDSELQTLTTL